MGFDIQRIAKIESVPGEHFCPVCQLLINPNEALQSITTKACPYDRYLVTETDAMLYAIFLQPLVESNKVLADTIGKTVVYCLYQNSGCTWLGSLSASSLHDLRCAFGNSLVMCTRCGVKTAHLQWHEHAQVCPEMQVQMHAYNEANVVMATSHASEQDHGVAAASLTQDQWYQQPYQQDYQNDDGYSMHQQRLHLPSLAPQHQVLYAQPEIHYGAQTHSPMQAQPQLQSQSYPSVPSHPQHPSLTFPASQGLINVQAQSHFQQVPDVHPPQPLPTMHKQQRSLPSQLTSAQYWKQMVRKYGRPPVSESSSGLHSSQQPLPNPSLPQQHTTAPTADVVHKQMHQGGHFHNQHLAVKSHLCPIGLAQRLQKYPQVHQPVTPIPGFQHKMNQHSASASQVGSGPAAPSLPAVKEYPSLNTPLLKHALLEQDGRRHLNTVVQEYLKTVHLRSEDVERSGDYFSGLSDRDFDQISPIRAREEHEAYFEFRPASRFSQPSIDLGDRQFRGGPSILNGLRLPDIVDFRSKYTSQGFSGDGGSFPVKILLSLSAVYGDVESSLNSTRKATGTVEGRRDQAGSKGNLKSSENSSLFGNPNKNEKEDSEL
ncbi:hypothetical protein HID58_051178 [Brassica napus]|uniref:Uncharacterized protein n=1 Tax=Brassica napus TaxID=3708 RepID=A0ABQ8A890_BRANA|nr:hypothetical protein HID58_051178 [Brassica napus]